MLDISKKIVMDEEGTPVAVQIDYSDWEEIEKVLRNQPSVPTDEDDGFEQALTASRNTWAAGDGLEHQRRLRSG
jgi:hypothetical protein